MVTKKIERKKCLSGSTNKTKKTTKKTVKKTTSRGLSGATRKNTHKRSVKVQVERRARKQDRDFYGEPLFYYDWERGEAIVEGYSEAHYEAAKRYANQNLKYELPNGFSIMADFYNDNKWHFIVR